MVRKAVACFRPEAQVEDRLEDIGSLLNHRWKGPDPDETTLRSCALEASDFSSQRDPSLYSYSKHRMH